VHGQILESRHAMKECVRSKDYSRNTIKCGSEALVYHVTEERSESRVERQNSYRNEQPPG
jgi:hypothetical protein